MPNWPPSTPTLDWARLAWAFLDTPDPAVTGRGWFGPGATPRGGRPHRGCWPPWTPRPRLALVARDNPGHRGCRHPGSPAEAADRDGWGPLHIKKFPPVLPFPLDVLPIAAARFACVGAESIGCPVDFLAAPILVMAGGATGRRAWPRRLQAR